MSWDYPPPRWPFALDKDKTQEDGLIGLWSSLGPSPHNYVYDLVGGRNFAFASTPPVWDTTGEKDWPLALDCGTSAEARKMTVPHEAWWDLTDRLTLTAWFTSPLATQNWGILLGKPYTTFHTPPYFNYVLGTTGNKARGIFFKVDPAGQSETVLNAWDINTVTHAVGRWDKDVNAGSVDIFLQGEEASYSPQVSGTTAITPSSQDLHSGTTVTGVNVLEGQVFELRAYNRRLEDIEIARLYDPQTRWGDYVELGKRKYFVPVAPVGGRIMSSLAGHGGLAGRGGIAGEGGGLAG